jgi:hypothetical protein
MSLEEITLGGIAACNSLPILACIPQIRKAATDENGATAISFTTWILFLVTHLSTVAYAIAVAHGTHRRHARRWSAPVSAWSSTAVTVNTGASLVPSGCKGNQ